MNTNGNQRAPVKLAALPQTSTTPTHQEPAAENGFSAILKRLGEGMRTDVTQENPITLLVPRTSLSVIAKVLGSSERELIPTATKAKKRSSRFPPPLT
jgi:hypothetical protein